MNQETNHETNHEKRRGMKRGNTAAGTKLLYATLAGGIAALLTYYFAPKSWSKFTREITGAARKGWNQIEKSAEWVGEEAQTFYKAAKTEANVIYDAAGKAVSSAEPAIAGIPQDLQDEKARVAVGFEASRKAYNGDGASQKAAAAKTN